MRSLHRGNGLVKLHWPSSPKGFNSSAGAIALGTRPNAHSSRPERAKLGDGGIANSRNRSTYGEQDVDVIAGPARLKRGRFQIVQNTDDVTV
jgi:hypothetical protein